MDTLITIEGADATGKSTVHRGFDKDGKRTSGLVERLKVRLNSEVHPSREPGAYTSGEGRWWNEEPSVGLEPHLQTFERYAGWAATHTAVRHTQAHRVIVAACFAARHGSLPEPIYESLLEGIPFSTAYEEEIKSIYESFQEHIKLLNADPTLSQRVYDTPARSLLRLALMKPDEKLHPTAAGLTFFAGHILHSEWAASKNGVVVSDRAGESQKAYAAARGDDLRVIDLYEEHQPLKPDLVLLLTCNQEVMKERLVEESPEEDWAGLGTAMSVQAKYKELLQRNGAPPYIEIDTSRKEPSRVIDRATTEVIGWLSHNSPTTPSAKTTA